MGDGKLKVRMATLDDVEGITEVHCSDVDKWFKWIRGEKVQARYEELSVGERYRHGGPWMSIETCAIHINYVLTSGQYPLVAELEGKIVGELELYIGEERGDLGKTAFIDILEVHKDYRKRGVGRALINTARMIAIKENCSTLTVWPDKRVIPFYRKCGLNKTAYNIAQIIVDTRNVPKPRKTYSIQEFPNKYPVRSLWLVSPRIYSSFAAWLKSRWNYALNEARTTVYSGFIPELQAAFILESYWMRREEATAWLWIESKDNIRDVLSWLCQETSKMGYKKLRLLVERQVYEDWIKNTFSSQITGEELLLKEVL